MIQLCFAAGVSRAPGFVGHWIEEGQDGMTGLHEIGPPLVGIPIPEWEDAPRDEASPT